MRIVYRWQPWYKIYRGRAAVYGSIWCTWGEWWYNMWYRILCMLHTKQCGRGQWRRTYGNRLWYTYKGKNKRWRRSRNRNDNRLLYSQRKDCYKSCCCWNGRIFGHSIGTEYYKRGNRISWRNASGIGHI